MCTHANMLLGVFVCVHARVCVLPARVCVPPLQQLLQLVEHAVVSSVRHFGLRALPFSRGSLKYVYDYVCT